MKGLALKSQVVSLFDVVKSRSTSDELCFICPASGCGDRTGNRYVNLRTGKTNCWRCNSGGDFVRWARRLGFEVEDNGDVGGASSTETSQIIDELTGRRDLHVPTFSGVSLPSGFELLSENRGSVYERLARQLAESKHLCLEDFLDVGAGFTRDNPVWEPFLIFPVIEWGHVVYYQGRKFKGKPGESTKLFPSRSEVKLGSRNWVYGIDDIRSKKARTVIVVEAIFNVLSLKRKLQEVGERSVATVCVFKHAVSDVQLSKIADCNISEICLMFDRDAIESAWKQASRLVDRCRVTVAELPDVGVRTLDPNDNVELALEAFGKRHEFSVTSQLLRMIE